MREDDLKRAKDLYFDNLGSAFYMVKHGVYREYREYEIAPEQEALWRSELISEMAQSLSGKDLSLVSNLAAIAQFQGDSVVVESIISFVLNQLHTLDSFAIMVYAEYLWNMASQADTPLASKPFSQARGLALRMWHSVVQNPVRLDEGRQVDFGNPTLTVEENIRKWAELRLSQADNKRTGGQP